MTIKANGQEKDIEYLLEIEKRYQILVENANDAICFISPEGKYLFYNPKFLEMFGYTDAEMEGKTFYDIVHPDDLSLVKKRRMKRLRGADVPRNYEYRAVTKDGKTLHIETNATLVKRGDKVLGIQTILRDVTERKKTEEVLRESEKKYSTLVEKGNDGIVIIQDSLLKFVNAKTLEITGFSMEEAVGKSFIDFVSPEYRELVMDRYKKRMSGGKVPNRYEIEILSKDGRTIPVEISATRIEYKDKPADMAIIRDITERKKAEEALKESEERLRTVIEASMDAIVAVNDQGIVVLFNPAAEELFLYSPDEVLNKPVGILLLEDVAEAHQKRLEKFLSKGVGQCGHIGRRLERTFKRKDGTLFEAEVAMSGGRSNGKRLVVVSIHDITERKKAEEALRESEEKYRGIFDESIAAVYVFDKKKNFIDSNPAGLDLLGYSRVELLNMNISDVDADPIVVLPAHEQLLSGERIINYEHKLKKKDGTIITVLNNSKPLTDVDGNVLGMQSTLIDITERKLAEEELKETKDFLDNIIESSADSIVTTNIEGKITSWSEGAKEIFGYNPEDIIGRPVEELYPPELKERRRKWQERIRKGETIRNERTKVYNSAGELVDINLTLSLLRDKDGKPIGTVGVAKDIRPVLEAEEEIKRLKEFNENIVQSMTEGIMIEDENGIITFANPKTEELLGYSKGELIGKHWKETASPEYLKKIEEETAKRPKGISSSYEAAILSKTGDKIPIIISATPLFEDDVFKGVLTVFTDIRELKILERQHIDARNEAEFYIDLMGHDINNDNTVAQGLLSLILEDSSELSEEQSKLIALALKAVRRSANLIDSVRTLQIAKATGEEVFKKTDLSAVLDNAINEAKALHNDKEILINYTPKGAYVFTDKLVKDLFLNLIDNAAKYDLSDEVNIDIEIEDMGGSWKIGIKDHGSGIPDDLKEVIFTRFQRIDKGTRGSGIGLHLVKTLIDKYNGNIYVEDRVKGDHSKGSMFYVTLPKG